MTSSPRHKDCPQMWDGAAIAPDEVHLRADVSRPYTGDRKGVRRKMEEKMIEQRFHLLQ
jgi:hypothetical protein